MGGWVLGRRPPSLSLILPPFLILMLKNNLKIALRTLRRQPGYTFINVTGLAIGILCCVFTTLYVLDELRYDRFHEDADEMYRITLDLSFGDQETRSALSAVPVAPTMVRDLPAVEQATRLWRDTSGRMTVRYQDQAFLEDRVLFADSNVFDVFSFPLLRGNPATALQNPYTIVITERMVRKYFGTDDPMGKTLRIREPSDRDIFEYEVTGVVQNPPAHSHIQFDFLAAFTTQRGSRSENWLNVGVYTYLTLRDGADAAAVEPDLSALVARYAGPQIQENLGSSLTTFTAEGNRYSYHLQPLTRIHLYSRLDDELTPNGDIRYVYLFGAVALFVLLLACINFINLATARAVGRAREVGVRKALGSGRGQLIQQFLTESTLLSFLALVLALILYEAFLPVLNAIAHKNLGDSLPNPLLAGTILVGFTLMVGLLAGSYPAFALSAFRPARVLKTGSLQHGKRSTLRNGLVVFQFAITIVLIAGTAVITNQMRYIQQKKLGFDAEQVIVLEGAEVMGRQIEAFKEALLKQPGIVNATNSELVPGRPFAADLFRLEGASDDALVSLQYTYTGFDFVETLGLDLVAGRSLSREYTTDSLAVLLNKSAVARLGLNDPVGKRLVWPNESTYTIVGVVEDFHTASFRQEIGPVVLLGPDPRNTNRPNLLVSARIETDDISRTLAAAEATWKTFAPTQPFRYAFLDQDFAALYRAEHITGRIFSGFALLAVLIACFGLFGLAAFTATQRTKEIGIRKVLGATVPGIVLLLSREFLKLVGIAFVIAVPVAYFLMRQWLDNFAYRVDIGVGVFLFTGGLALLIALATVSYQAIKAALADPVQSLRYE